MKNREKYKDEIIDAILSGAIIPFANEKITDKYGKYKYSTTEELLLFAMWLDEEYVEPEVDWTKVEVDTPIWVSNDGKHWDGRHFAKYEDGNIYAWYGGFTSWTRQEVKPRSWKYGELAEETNDTSNDTLDDTSTDTDYTEVDWSKVEVDTPILVTCQNGNKRRRYFAEYRNGAVRAWDHGGTSWSCDNNFLYTSPWDHAELIEEE